MDAELLQLLEEKKHRDEGRKFFRTFPEEGRFSRYAYPKQMEFFALGKEKRFRLLMGANGSGKSVSGAFETTCHATGYYPDWWEGKRFTRAVNAWIAGVDFKTLRESLQTTLLGTRGKEGTGMIPRDSLVAYKYRSSPPDTLDYIEVKNVAGGTSRLVLKSYEEGRESFQAANVDFCWLDEEPPWDIYSECIQRFRGNTALGQLILTFTPLFGVSDVICMFVPTFMTGYDEVEYERSSRAYVSCTMDDVPHISPEEKALKIANTLPHEREARINGQPSVGEGRVYPFAEDSFVIDPIPGGLPRHWPRIYGMDPGRVVTAAVWLAHDTDTDTIYVYSEHYGKDQLPPVHAQAIKMRGMWIPGIIDISSGNSNAVTDDSLLKIYTDEKWKLGLRLKTSDGGKGSVGEGIFEIYTRLATGRLKIYKTCTALLREIRQYSRDKQNRIIKRDDHACFAAGTLVNGRPIETHGFLTRRDAEVVRLEFEDGRKIVCTPDHKFLVEGGKWIAAYQLTQNRVLSPPPYKNSWVGSITYAALIFSAMVIDCIARSMNMLSDLFRKACMFITSIMTGQIMFSPILNYCQVESMPHIITKGFLNSSPKPQKMEQGNGMEVMLGRIGTRITGKYIPNRFFLSVLNWCANTAGNLMRQAASIAFVRNSVIRTAKPLRCVRVVELSEKHDVYCIAEKDGWVGAEGLIASNCDAMRYGIMGIRHAMLPHEDLLSNRTPKIKEETYGLFGP